MTLSSLPRLGPLRGPGLDRRRVLGGFAAFGGPGFGDRVSNPAVARDMRLWGGDDTADGPEAEDAVLTVVAALYGRVGRQA